MSEEKAPRTAERIQQDFENLSARAGHCQYQIYIFEKDLELLNEQIRDLNFEMAKLRASEAPKAE